MNTYVGNNSKNINLDIMHCASFNTEINILQHSSMTSSNGDRNKLSQRILGTNPMYQIQNNIMNRKNQITPTATTMITRLFAKKLTKLDNVNLELILLV